MEKRKQPFLQKFVDPLPIPKVLQPLRRAGCQTYYEVKMVQFKQKLHRDLKETTLWGYEGSYPGPTIEVEANEQTYIKWMNYLPSKHLLPIDHTVHGAGLDVPDVRTVAHVHGGNTEPESDGYPEAWFTNCFQKVGPYFQKKVYHYGNQMPATALWYHDHALGITRLNVYAGLAGMYIIRDKKERMLNLPSGAFEIPLVIQDKSFNEDGSLYYPTQPTSPTALDVSVVPEFLGEVNLVNGKVWPYLEVEPRKYRFRLLNAANSRFYQLSFDSGQLFYQIGTDGGLKEKPIGVSEILLAPAERADVIIDFSNQQNQTIVLKNNARAPYPNGEEVDPHTIGIVMKFKVSVPLSHIDTSVIPRKLVQYGQLTEQMASKNRLLTLDSVRDTYGRGLMLLDHKKWDEPITELPYLGTTEVWSFINLTDKSHPIHLHLGSFQILDRRLFNIAKFEAERKLDYLGPPTPPTPQEIGLKDTVISNPNEVTRIIKKFDSYTGLYVWHCHILEHEDYEMMRPFIVLR
ncbi:multicopper oxidase family protein [Alkalihalobacillus sp. 1P02AB]|uniref:multicopper oxidase family protein n=1 Tax=Alkalihalobacillus sp. 1P02AB TaxID=3132260 RepID=UPI0039A77F2B